MGRAVEFFTFSAAVDGFTAGTRPDRGNDGRDENDKRDDDIERSVEFRR